MEDSGSSPPKKPRRNTKMIAVAGAARVDRVLIPTLTVTGGIHAGTVFTFSPEEEVTKIMGRERSAPLRIRDATLSSQHAEFHWHKVEGKFVMEVTDLESTNGTLVEGRAIARAILKDGDRLQLGEVSLRFQLVEKTELAASKELMDKVGQSQRDGLTSLANRRYFDELLPRLLREADARGNPVCLALFDLDHFKSINDNHGHLVGDEVLRVTSRLIQSRVHTGDVAVRFGGEEFLVLLPATRLEDGAALAESIRAAIASYDPAAIAPGLELSVSVGVTERRAGEPLPAALERADKALYESKRSGRDRVTTVTADGTPVLPRRS